MTNEDAGWMLTAIGFPGEAAAALLAGLPPAAVTAPAGAGNPAGGRDV